MPAEQHAHAEHAFVAYDCDFGRTPVGHEMHKGNDAAGRKIKMLHLVARFEKRCMPRQRYQLPLIT